MSEASPEPLDRHGFLRLVVLFEGGVLAVAIGVGWLVSINPFARLAWTAEGGLWGTVAALPIFVLFLIGQRVPLRALQRIREFLDRSLGPVLAECRWYDLLGVALLAGIGEEALFRGVLQPWLGLTWSNVAFGLAHAVTPLYAVLAGGIGFYLGWLFDTTGNLLAPVLAHTLYDFLAFVVVARHARQRQAAASDEV